MFRVFLGKGVLDDPRKGASEITDFEPWAKEIIEVEVIFRD